MDFQDIYNNPSEIINNILNHKVNEDTTVFFNKIYPLFCDFLNWKNISNKDPNYQSDYHMIRERINDELDKAGTPWQGA